MVTKAKKALLASLAAFLCVMLTVFGLSMSVSLSETAKAADETSAVAKVGTTTTTYGTLNGAIGAAAEGDTVTLLKDTTEDVVVNKNITLDLGGMTLTGKNSGKATLTIAKGATATVKNGSVIGTSSFYNIQNNGTATFETLTATAGNTGSSMIDNWGTLTINSGVYSGGLNVVKSEEGSTLVINGGEFTLSYSKKWDFNAVILVYGDTTIKGGTFIQNAKTASSYPQVVMTGVVDGYASVTKITGGTFINNFSGTRSGIFWALGDATSDNFEVSGGTFNKPISEGYCAEGFIPSTTKNADGTYGVKACVAKVGSTKYETLAEAIAAAKDGETVKLLADCSGDGIVVAANKFTDKGLIVDFGGYTYTIGGVLVGSSGTKSNGFQLLIGNKITFRNGGIVGDKATAGDDKTDWTGAAAIMIQNYCDLTLEKMVISGGEETVYTMSNNNGDVVIEDTTINAGKAKGYTSPAFAFDVCRYSSYPSVSVTVRGNSVINGNVEISGAIGEGQNRQLNVENGTFNGTFSVSGNVPANIAISGGTFKNAVPAEYCAEGFIPQDNGDGTFGVKVGTYVAEVKGVKYETLQAAFDAAKAGNTVTLLANTKENVTIAKKITLDLNGYTINGGTVKATPTILVSNCTVTITDSSKAKTGTVMREDTAENSGVSSHYVIDIQGKNGFLIVEGGNFVNNSGAGGTKGASLIRLGDDRVSAWPTLTIKGGTFTQDNFIVLKVDRGTLHFLGGTLNSAKSYAVENWNNAYIKGGTINGAVSSWVCSGGAAFSKLEISAGTINGDVESVSYDGSEDKQARVYITGGTVTGTLSNKVYSGSSEVTTAMATIEVTGGTFDIDPSKYITEAAVLDKTEDGKFGVKKVVLAEIVETGVQYYTMDEAFHAVNAGETIKLLRNYTTDKVQNSGSKSFTIDLGGFTWTYTRSDADCAAFEINYPDVTLTVKNGTVVSNSMIGLIPSAMSGTITYNNAGLIFENVNMTAKGHSGFETNGNNVNDTITLIGGELHVDNGYGIYFASTGTLTINGTKIFAKTMGVQICSGSLVISGDSEITVTGDAVPKAENDGAIQDGAAISIVNRPGYKGLSNIVITGGTFTAKAGNDAIKAYDWVNKVESTFTKADLVAVSGGTFSSEVEKDYLADGFVVNKNNTDGTYGVTEGSGFAGACVVVTESLAMKVVVSTASKYVVVTYKGLDGIAKTVRLDKFTDIRIKGEDYKYCLFDQIMPQMIDVKFSFELYGENDVMLDRKANYSVVDYLADIIASDKDSAEFRNVAASLIEYANRAKVVKGLTTTVAPTFVDKAGNAVELKYNEFVAANKIPAKNTVGEISEGNGKVIYKARVVFDDAYTLTFYTNDNEKQYTYKLDDKDIVFDENGEYTVNVLAQNITTKYVLTVYDKDSKLVQTVTYGVSTYCIRMQETKTPQGELYVASYYYGVAVNQYGTANPNSVQG